MSLENKTDQQTTDTVSPPTDSTEEKTQTKEKPEGFNPLEMDSDSPELAGEEQARYSPNFKERYVEIEELLEYAAESGKLDSIELAMDIKEIKKKLFYTPPEELGVDELCKTEADLEILYSRISELVAPVTLLTLRTTSTNYEVDRIWWKAIFLGSGSVGRNFFRKMLWIAVALISVIFLKRYIIGGTPDPQSFAAYVDPFLYGGLGALIYLYKDLTDDYIGRTLNPKQLAANWLRIFMGGLTGGILYHLFGATLQGVPNIGPAAIGFLGGYSVDFFYQTLDKIIHALSPKTSPPANQPVATTAKQAEIEMLTKSLKDATNEEDKAAIRKLLEKV
ncbi:hypothetical protein QUF74_14320 [Candidatus Halobeggiatoa sp. HSG11]|nr:hypothetical protein [Candidatus Halobeggiatoa sp. HSG11]